MRDYLNFILHLTLHPVYRDAQTIEKAKTLLCDVNWKYSMDIEKGTILNSKYPAACKRVQF